MTRGQKQSAVRATVPGTPLLPQVNLLPPEIRAGRALSSVKSWLAVGLLATLLVAGGLVLMSELGLRDAEDALTRTQDENAALVAQQTQYAEVPALLGKLDDLTQARTSGMAGDVLWRPYVTAIAATAPAGVSVTELKVAPPVASLTATTGGVADLVVATISFQSRSLTLPDTAQWLDALAEVTGLSNPMFSSAQIKGTESGVVYYEVTGTVDVTFDGLSMRYFPVDETAETADDTSAETEAGEG